jgi:hypothetical protein
MNLVFENPLELIAIAGVAFALNAIASDGEMTWSEGVASYPFSRQPSFLSGLKRGPSRFDRWGRQKFRCIRGPAR